PLRWTCKGTRRLAQELRARGYRASHSLVSQLLQDAGYQLQANGKAREASHVHRAAQFQYIDRQVRDPSRRDELTILIAARKRKLTADVSGGGGAGRRNGGIRRPPPGDFANLRRENLTRDAALDVGRKANWICADVASDMASFVVNAIRRWWRQMGRPTCPR